MNPGKGSLTLVKGLTASLELLHVKSKTGYYGDNWASNESGNFSCLLLIRDIALHKFAVTSDPRGNFSSLNECSPLPLRTLQIFPINANVAGARVCYYQEVRKLP